MGSGRGPGGRGAPLTGAASTACRDSDSAAVDAPSSTMVACCGKQDVGGTSGTPRLTGLEEQHRDLAQVGADKGRLVVAWEPKLRPTMQCHVGLYFLSNSLT